MPQGKLNENRNLMLTERGKACLILISSTNTNCESMAYRSFKVEKFSARGARKVTTGITGLWQPSAHSDVAFWSFDVGSSYHWGRRRPKVSDCSPVNQGTWAGFRPSRDRLVLSSWGLFRSSNPAQYERNSWFRYLVMQLIEQLVLQSYHLLRKGWTPLSPNWSW